MKGPSHLRRWDQIQLGIEPGPHWWEADVLTTRPPEHPLFYERRLLTSHFHFSARRCSWCKVFEQNRRRCSHLLSWQSVHGAVKWYHESLFGFLPTRTTWRYSSRRRAYKACDIRWQLKQWYSDRSGAVWCLQDWDISNYGQGQRASEDYLWR